MLIKEIYNLKEIGAEHLLQYKCQPYAEGWSLLGMNITCLYLWKMQK